MLALITGASSGIGADIAKYLASKQINLILVARREEKLNELKLLLNNVEVTIIPMDLSSAENCVKLHELTKSMGVDILINNAGLGDIGNFEATSLEKELNIISVNDVSLHVLTKLFYQDFIKKQDKYILNVCSAASFAPSPFMATYYASKAYSYRLTLGIYEENRINDYGVHISALCPGPVRTEFEKVANVKFSYKMLDSSYVAKYAIDQMFKDKLIIVPGIMYKTLAALTKITPTKMQLRILSKSAKKRK